MARNVYVLSKIQAPPSNQSLLEKHLISLKTSQSSLFKDLTIFWGLGKLDYFCLHRVENDYFCNDKRLILEVSNNVIDVSDEVLLESTSSKDSLVLSPPCLVLFTHIHFFKGTTKETLDAFKEELLSLLNISFNNEIEYKIFDSLNPTSQLLVFSAHQAATITNVLCKINSIKMKAQNFVFPFSTDSFLGIPFSETIPLERNFDSFRNSSISFETILSFNGRSLNSPLERLKTLRDKILLYVCLGKGDVVVKDTTFSGVKFTQEKSIVCDANGICASSQVELAHLGEGVSIKGSEYNHLKLLSENFGLDSTSLDYSYTHVIFPLNELSDDWVIPKKPPVQDFKLEKLLEDFKSVLGCIATLKAAGFLKGDKLSSIISSVNLVCSKLCCICSEILGSFQIVGLIDFTRAIYHNFIRLLCYQFFLEKCDQELKFSRDGVPTDFFSILLKYFTLAGKVVSKLENRDSEILNWFEENEFEKRLLASRFGVSSDLYEGLKSRLKSPGKALSFIVENRLGVRLTRMLEYLSIALRQRYSQDGNHTVTLESSSQFGVTGVAGVANGLDYLGKKFIETYKDKIPPLRSANISGFHILQNNQSFFNDTHGVVLTPFSVLFPNPARQIPIFFGLLHEHSHSLISLLEKAHRHYALPKILGYFERDFRDFVFPPEDSGSDFSLTKEVISLSRKLEPSFEISTDGIGVQAQIGGAKVKAKIDYLGLPHASISYAFKVDNDGHVSAFGLPENFEAYAKNISKGGLVILKEMMADIFAFGVMALEISLEDPVISEIFQELHKSDSDVFDSKSAAFKYILREINLRFFIYLIKDFKRDAGNSFLGSIRKVYLTAMADSTVPTEIGRYNIFVEKVIELVTESELPQAKVASPSMSIFEKFSTKTAGSEIFLFRNGDICSSEELFSGAYSQFDNVFASYLIQFFGCFVLPATLIEVDLPTSNSQAFGFLIREISQKKMGIGEYLDFLRLLPLSADESQSSIQK